MFFFGVLQNPETAGTWLGFIRRYLVMSAFAHLVWEFAHMPLYTLWRDDSALKIFFFGLHCTAGDIAIACAALLTALLLVGRPAWPKDAYGRVAALTIALGFAYTIYSEWLNVYVRKSWSYADNMPLVPPLEIGLTPLLQWLFVPSAVLLYCRVCQKVGKSSQGLTDHIDG